MVDKKTEFSDGILIAFDIDDVIARLGPSLFRWNNKLYGNAGTQNKGKALLKDHKTYALHKTWSCSEQEALRRVLEFYQTDFFKNLPPVPGAIECVYAVKNILKKYYDDPCLPYITSRPTSTDVINQNWFDKYTPGVDFKIHYSDHYFSDGPKAAAQTGKINKSKGILCKKINAAIIVDDCLEYCLDCSEHGIFSMLFDLNGSYGHNKLRNLPEGMKKLPENIVRVKNHKEVFAKYSAYVQMISKY